MAALNTNLMVQEANCGFDLAKISYTQGYLRKVANHLCVLSLKFMANSDTPKMTYIGVTVPESCRPVMNTECMLSLAGTVDVYNATLDIYGGIFLENDTLPSGWYSINMCYVTS